MAKYTGRLFIGVGSPKEGHAIAYFQNLSRTGEKDWWYLKLAAGVGDLVVFYAASPIQEFVATGRIAGDYYLFPDKASRWYGKPQFDVNKFAMLPRSVPLEEVRIAFPKWHWPTHPQNPKSEVPSNLVDRFLQLLQLPPIPPPTTDPASDLTEPPGKVLTTTYRILRDTEITRRVKRMYDYKCQVCNLRITLPNGNCYAEGHHVRPLGGEHKGHDVVENVLCLCPNHHAEFDYGVRPIVLAKLRVVDGHEVSKDVIKYHNTKIYKSK